MKNKNLFAPGINNYLDVSTAHISLNDNELLTCLAGYTSDVPLIVDGFEGGYWVNVHPDLKDNYHEYVETLINFGFSPEFVTILENAGKLGCNYVKLDGIGTMYEGVKTFDW